MEKVPRAQAKPDSIPNSPGDVDRVVDDWFRHESSKIIAVLTRVLGVHNLELAEDIVQDTLCRALQVWKYAPLPANPAAWLMTVAKNRALNLIRGENTSRKFAKDIGDLMSTEWSLSTTVTALFEQHEIDDDQLRMMFLCCMPELSSEMHVTIILKLLCGFSTREIARAFLTTEAAIDKRLTRAKTALRESDDWFDVAGGDAIQKRLGSVEWALYLLFSEGYHSSHPEVTVRADLCREAMRLCTLVVEHPAVHSSSSRALLALMCLDAARLGSRVSDQGWLIRLTEQDRSQWDQGLIQLGLRHLADSTVDSQATVFHVEAGIAALHCTAAHVEETDWEGILQHYDLLMQMRPTPIVALNRAIVIGQLGDPDAGIAALTAIPRKEKLKRYPFFFAAQGEFHDRAGRRTEARAAFKEALTWARNPAESRFIQNRIDASAD